MIVQKVMPKSLTDAANASFKHSSDRVDKRLAMDTDRPDIFGLVLKHKDGANMSRQMMYSNADLLMIAGTETTATMLSGLTYNLLRNPGPMKRLTAEIRERFASEDDITIDELPRLPERRHQPRNYLMNAVKKIVSDRLHRGGPENVPLCR